MMINVARSTNRNRAAKRVCGLLAQYSAERGVSSTLEATPLATHNWRMPRECEAPGVYESDWSTRE